MSHTDSYSDKVNPGSGDRTRRRMRLELRGMVQGVGFRPFVYRLANSLELAGWVCNSPQGVQVELEGGLDRLNLFIDRLHSEAPPNAHISGLDKVFLDTAGYSGFTVRESSQGGEKEAVVLPDIATCPDCLSDIRDPRNRRYRYPFTNCTNCGPRFSIILSLPYDRARTTMTHFPMCEQCRAEYEDPSDRRFHAQPNACPRCGPHLELWNNRGTILALHDGALRQACDIIRAGEILALKGLGGFQLLVDVANDDAVERLRRRKGREEKPLALMYPDLAAVGRDCHITDGEQELLTSRQAPIVLLRRRTDARDGGVARSVAPHNPYLGVMLPYTPLHHIVMADLKCPVVATSGNISDEPICIDEQDAIGRLGHIADRFLVHNRPIARQVDDSVVQVVHGRSQTVRAARGFAPVTMALPLPVRPCLAVGAHLKNTAAIAGNGQVYLSQHVGDLETAQAYAALGEVVQSLSRLYEFTPEVTACDLHPDYASTRFAREHGLPVRRIQHHHAHVLSCMADNGLDGPVLGVAWDGTGLGTDGTVWGGEFLRVGETSFSRAAYFRRFPLPGGEKAVREPCRTAIGMLYEIYEDGAFDLTGMPPALRFTAGEIAVLGQMLRKSLNSPLTSSVGRLFDAVASILDLCHVNAFTGQAAMRLGFAAVDASSDDVYPFEIDQDDRTYRIDWEPMIRDILGDMQNGKLAAAIAAGFHNTLVEIIIDIAERVGEKNVVLSGGCFQNRYLSERTIRRLSEAGFIPHWHHRIPPNDGGIALGQIMAVARMQTGGT